MRICVFCGSKPGHDDRVAPLARSLGTRLAASDIGLVYGGAKVGIMGEVADAALAAGGEVIGVIPRGLFSREVPHDGLTDLRVVDDMHERKQTMYELADGFCALPGGLGTLEEVFEAATWTQLGLHDKPVVLLDHADFWVALDGFLDRLVADGFVFVENRSIIRRVASIDEAIDACRP